MNTKGINLTRKEITRQMRGILEPWVSDIDLIDEINEETNLIADLGLDSVGILQVVLGAEKEFGISIKDHELDSQVFSRMSNFIGIIEKKVYEDN